MEEIGPDRIGDEETGPEADEPDEPDAQPETGCAIVCELRVRPRLCPNSSEVHCDKTTYLCVECRSNGDCPKTDVCDPEIKRCAKRCASTSMCTADCFVETGPMRVLLMLEGLECTDPAYPRCDHQCFQCLDDRDCASAAQGPFCWLQRRRCVECLQDSDCSGDGVTCTTGQHICRHI